MEVNIRVHKVSVELVKSTNMGNILVRQHINATIGQKMSSSRNNFPFTVTDFLIKASDDIICDPRQASNCIEKGEDLDWLMHLCSLRFDSPYFLREQKTLRTPAYN